LGETGEVCLSGPGGVGSVQSTTVSRGVRIRGSNAGYTMFRGSVMGTGYPLHSPVSPSLPLPCDSVCLSHFNWTLPSVQNFLTNKKFQLFFVEIWKQRTAESTVSCLPSKHWAVFQADTSAGITTRNTKTFNTFLKRKALVPLVFPFDFVFWIGCTQWIFTVPHLLK